jgi:hypothetical protein
MNNGSATNITGLTNTRIAQHFYITLNSANDVLVAPESGGNFYTCTTHNIVGPAPALEFFIFNTGSPALVIQQANCQAVNQDWWQVGFAGQTVPAVQSLALLDVYATGRFRKSALLAAPAITTSGASGAFTYSYAYKAWVGGGFSFSQIGTTNVTPPVTTGPSSNVKIFVALPLGTTHYELYRQATTDGSFTPGLIAQGDVAVSGHPSAPQTIPIFDTNTAPINTNVIPTAQIGITTTGGVIIGRSIPATATEPCHTGDQVDDPVGNFRYWCKAENTWVRAPLTYATF